MKSKMKGGIGGIDHNFIPPIPLFIKLLIWIVKGKPLLPFWVREAAAFVGLNMWHLEVEDDLKTRLKLRLKMRSRRG